MKFKFIIINLIFATLLFAQDTIVFKKDYLPKESKNLVFLPKNYKNKNLYPVLFLLHGYSGSYSDWSKNVDLNKLATKFGFIIVCPEGFYSGWYLDSPIKKNNQYITFFWQDLYPSILKKYKVNTKNIFITGLSMGGHGAMMLYLPNQNKFNAAGSMSGILDIRLFPKKWEIKDLLGVYNNKNKKNWDKYSAIELLKTYGNKKTKLIIDCGKQDFAYQSNLNFINEAKKLKLNVEFNNPNGDHNWEFWKNTIEKHLSYFKKNIKCSKDKVAKTD